MIFKIPPPPDMGRDNQRLNRWLLEIQSIFNTGGFIDPSQVQGLPETTAQVVQNTTDITTLEGETAGNTTSIDTLNGQIVALQTQITALQSRSQVLNGIIAPVSGTGNVGDWYADTVGLHIYVKTAPTVWTGII